MNAIPFTITRRALCRLLASAAAGLTVNAAFAQTAARIISHIAGETEIKDTPTRIVALEFSFVQTLDALNMVPLAIADDNQPKRIEQLLGRVIEYNSVGTRLEPNLELISALAPDLIIADDIRHSKIYPQLSAIAPTIVLNSWEGDYETIKASVLVIADALGDKARGEAAIAVHDRLMADFRSKIPADENRRFLLAVATADTMSLHSSASFTGSVFKALGLQPALNATKPVESGAGLERLIAINPDVLLVATDPGGTAFDQWKDNAAFQNIAASKNHKIFEVDRNQFSRFRGLRTAEMISREILKKVYDAG